MNLREQRADFKRGSSVLSQVSTPHTLHPTRYTLRPTPYTLHPQPAGGDRRTPLAARDRPIHTGDYTGFVATIFRGMRAQICTT